MSELSPENRALFLRTLNAPLFMTVSGEPHIRSWGALELLLNAARMEGSREAAREFVDALKNPTSEGGA